MNDLKNTPTNDEYSSISTFTVNTSSIFFDIDDIVLSLLYQPILKPTAIALYKLLLNEYFCERNLNNKKNHEHILKILDCDFNKFIEHKNHLEAIGLLKTFLQNNDQNEKHVSYVIYPPLAPKSFFNHFYLNKKLAFVLGTQDYEMIRQ